MPPKHSQVRKTQSTRPLGSSIVLWLTSHPKIIAAIGLLMLTTSIAAKVPGFAVPSELRFALIAFNLIAAYVLVAVLVIRLMPEMVEIVQRNTKSTRNGYR